MLEVLPMFTLIARRCFQAIPTLWLIATLTFFLLHLAPGGPFDEEKPIPAEIKKQIEVHYGLDLPLHEQYFQFLRNLLQGDLGPSYKYAGWGVSEIIAQSFPVSLELGFWSLLIAILIGIPIGVIASLSHGKFSELALMGVAMIGICLPTFVLGPLLLLTFSSGLSWFNPLGWDIASDRVLPSLTLGLFYACYIARLTRSGMLDTMHQEFIRTGRAKGLKRNDTRDPTCIEKRPLSRRILSGPSSRWTD